VSGIKPNRRPSWAQISTSASGTVHLRPTRVRSANHHLRNGGRRPPPARCDDRRGCSPRWGAGGIVLGTTATGGLGHGPEPSVAATLSLNGRPPGGINRRPSAQQQHCRRSATNGCLGDASTLPGPHRQPATNPHPVRGQQPTTRPSRVVTVRLDQRSRLGGYSLPPGPGGVDASGADHDRRGPGATSPNSGARHADQRPPAIGNQRPAAFTPVSSRGRPQPSKAGITAGRRFRVACSPTRTGSGQRRLHPRRNAHGPSAANNIAIITVNHWIGRQPATGGAPLLSATVTGQRYPSASSDKQTTGGQYAGRARQSPARPIKHAEPGPDWHHA